MNKRFWQGIALALAVGSTAAPSARAAARPEIAYSTYLGGSGHPWSPDKDAGNDVAVDAAGNVYVTGATNSLGRWDADVFVRKLDPSGTELLYETYLDANGTDDVGFGIAVDATGSAYVTGRLGDSLLGRGLGAFVAKLGPDGAPVYQVTFGADGAFGLSGDFGARVAVDAGGNAYVSGTTFAPIDQPFPTTPGAFQRTHGGGLTDAFAVKLGPSGDVVWATLLGGGQFDRGWGIAVDAAGSAYVVGDSQGDFPTTAGSFQPAFHGGSDAFVAKLSPSGDALAYSTYVGGNGTDAGLAIALDADRNAHLTGSTSQQPTTVNDFPVVNAFQPLYGGALANAFVAKLDAAGAALLYSSYMGGSGSNLEDAGLAIEVDAAGHAYLAGHSQTFPDSISGYAFPIVDAFQPAHAGGVSDAFVAKLGREGTVAWSSYLGGGEWDGANGIALGPDGDVWVAGTTPSQDFPIIGAYQPSPGGGTNCAVVSCPDAFLTRLASDGAASPALVIAAGRIRLRDAKPDVLTLRGAVVPETRGDPSTTPATIEVADAGGVVASFALPPGALVKRGTTWTARDRGALRNGGVALLKLVVRPGRRSRITIKALGDLSRAIHADMVVTVTLGEAAYAGSRTWRARPDGWEVSARSP